MRALRPWLLSLTAFLIGVPVLAQQTTPTATSDSQAVALVQKSLAALTGGATVTDVTLTGTARRIAGSDDETGSATLEATALGDSRVELSFASGNRIEIRNHSALPLPGSLPQGVPASAARTPQAVGEWIGPVGAGHAMAGQNLMTAPDWFFPAIALERLLGSQHYLLSYIGQETHDGVALLHVSAIRPYTPLAVNSAASLPLLEAPPTQLISHASQMDFYFDPSTLLPMALDFNQHPDNNALIDIPVEIRFSTYKTISGVAVPMEVQRYFNGSLLFDFQFTSVTLNSGLSTSAFALQ